jgi:uncharacterized repeat protein (TIGR01451 family)
VRPAAAIVFAFALACAVSASAPAEPERSWTRQARVLGVVSGDTLDVSLATGERERVRLLGVRAPAAGSCFGAEARSVARRLAGGRRVVLSADRSRPQRDGAGRLLAYVAPGGRGDLGRTLVARSLAQVDPVAQGFARFAGYVPVQLRAETAGAGLWRECASDVAVAVEASAEQAVVGERVTYTVSLVNHGPLPAPNVVLDLRPPLGSTLVSGPASCRAKGWLATCAFGRLGYDARATATFVVELGRSGPASTRAAVRFDWCARADCGSTPLLDRNARNREAAALVTVLAAAPPPGAPRTAGCHPSYPTACIPYPPPDLACADIPHRDFHVRRDIPGADPHSFDGNEDGIGCQFDDY